jgi:hypothetical protein
MQFAFTTVVSLAPGFSPVLDRCPCHSRFNGFYARLKAAEAAKKFWPARLTRLKPGANENKTSPNNFMNSP